MQTGRSKKKKKTRQPNQKKVHVLIQFQDLSRYEGTEINIQALADFSLPMFPSHILHWCVPFSKEHAVTINTHRLQKPQSHEKQTPFSKSLLDPSFQFFFFFLIQGRKIHLFSTYLAARLSPIISNKCWCTLWWGIKVLNRRKLRPNLWAFKDLKLAWENRVPFPHHWVKHLMALPNEWLQTHPQPRRRNKLFRVI